MSLLKHIKFIIPRDVSILQHTDNLEADNKTSKWPRETLRINLTMVILQQPNLSFSIFGKLYSPSG